MNTHVQQGNRCRDIKKEKGLQPVIKKLKPHLHIHHAKALLSEFLLDFMHLTNVCTV